MAADSPITFLASFPAIQTAIKVYGDAQGMRIQLEIPESEMAEAVGLLALRDKVFRVTVERDDRESASRHKKLHI